MWRFFLFLILSLFSVSAVAQSADSTTFATAKRYALKLPKSAEGYTLNGINLFNSTQTISVIKYTPKLFSTSVILPDEVTKVSDVGVNCGAQFAINACYWAVKKGVPTTYIKSDGVVQCHSHTSGLPRVNGLMFMYDHGIEIVCSTEMPDYPSLAEKCDKCNNIIACGPVLLDDGVEVSYRDLIESQEESLQRKTTFFVRRHPRSVIGRDAEGNIYLVVVDGRASGFADGVSIAELTQLCKWLGMTEAMNLDGGGSSTLWSRKYGVINYPCDNRKFDHEGERKVMSTLIVKQKKIEKKRIKK